MNSTPQKIKKYALIGVLAVSLAIIQWNKSQELDAFPARGYSRYGLASWYSKASPGIKPRTANNEIFDDRTLTCAIWGVQFNRLIKVTNLQNGKSIVVRVNDRGPDEPYVRQGRIIDLTKEAFTRLNPAKKGLMPVLIEFL